MKIWWKRGPGALPALFQIRRRQGALIRTPHDDRPHEARWARLAPALDPDAWAARVAELTAARLSDEARRQLLDARFPLALLIRELEQLQQPPRVRRRTVEAVLTAATRCMERR
jgi:hypothetical protein